MDVPLYRPRLIRAARAGGRGAVGVLRAVARLPAGGLGPASPRPVGADQSGQVPVPGPGYLAWLAGSDPAGDPLNDPAARDWAVRDYRRNLKVARKAAPTTINNALAAIDDFCTRRGLGPAAGRREDPPPREAPRALSAQQSRRFLRVVEQEPLLRNKMLALLPYYAGLRIGEVVGLDVDDVASDSLVSRGGAKISCRGGARKDCHNHLWITIAPSER